MDAEEMLSLLHDYRQTIFMSRLRYRTVPLCLLLATALSAQPQGPQNIQEIIVTGSHIKSAANELIAPVTHLGRDELRYQGAPTVLDMILNLPFSQDADGESDRFQSGGGAGRRADRQ